MRSWLWKIISGELIIRRRKLSGFTLRCSIIGRQHNIHGKNCRKCRRKNPRCLQYLNYYRPATGQSHFFYTVENFLYFPIDDLAPGICYKGIIPRVGLQSPSSCNHYLKAKTATNTLYYKQYNSFWNIDRQYRPSGRLQCITVAYRAYWRLAGCETRKFCETVRTWA